MIKKAININENVSKESYKKKLVKKNIELKIINLKTK
jgi:hypothetical protein